MLVVFVGGLFWLNGPGLRWLGPKVAGRYLSKAGFRGTFELEGSLTGGFSVKRLNLESDKTLARLTVGRVTPAYQLGGLMKGRLEGIEIDGIHVELRLGVDVKKKEKEPLDLERLVETLRTVRSRVVGVNADIKDISLNATRDGNPVITLAPTRIRHKAGESNVDLEIGEITDATGRVWPAQKSTIVWNADDLLIERLDPLPGMSVRGLIVRLPASGGPSAETELHIDDAVFMVNASPGFSSVQVNLREGRLVSETLAGYFELKLPVSGELSSLSVNVENLLPDPKAATGSAQVLLENVAYGDWTVPELSLDAGLEAGRSTLAARGVALDTAFSLNAEAAIGREEGGFLLGETRGKFNVAEVSKLVAALAERVEAIDPEAPVPASTVDGDFRVSFANNRPESADVDLVLMPAAPETAASMTVKGAWQLDRPVSLQVELEGVTASADLDFETSGYQVRMDFSDFRSGRIDPWLGIGRAGTQGAISLTGTWRGSGVMTENRHQGSFALLGADLVREGVPPIHAQGEIEYDWPMGFTTKGLQLKAAEQSVTADLKMADGFLEMSEFLWRDGDAEMAAGTAKLPVPEDFSKWRETFAHDDRPVEVSIQSKVLSLASLKDWLPAAEKLDPRSTGRVELKVSGTYEKPVIDAMLEARDLRSPEQPKLPSADLIVTLVARDGRISVEGNATTPDFPPAVMTASMAFRPAEWAENPGLVMEEKISARVDLPRIDLSRFASLVPWARKFAGNVTGFIDVAGELGAPVAKGGLELTNGVLELKSPYVPPITGVSAALDLAMDRITLKQLSATVAGGTLSGGGSMVMDEGKPGAVDFQLKGDHIPVRRNDSLIVRANADLRLSGTWEQAAITGTIGVVDSLFFRDIELLPIGSPFTTPRAAELPRVDTPAKLEEAVPQPFRDWTLDVLVRTVNPFLIRGNLATGQVVGSVRVRGTIGSPAPDGVAEISDARASLPFSTLTVRSGTFRFTPEAGFDPILELRGTAEPRPYRVSAYVYGRASDPQLVLTSSPPLPENEIMTLLATGTTTSGLEDPQAASSRALQLFLEELRRGRFGIGKQLRPLLRALDRVDFTLAEKDPYSSETFSTATLQLTDRWFVSAGMGEEGDSRVLAIWRFRFY